MKKELLLFLTSNYPKFRVNQDLINNKYNLFDEVKLLNENNLDDHIKSIIKNIIDKYGNRGYGYWIWKPYLILQELNKLNNGDILVHLDCHCHLDSLRYKFNNITNYLIEVVNKPLIIGRIGQKGSNDYMYTTVKLKNAVENYLNYKFSESELTMPQCEAGIMFMKKNKFVINFFKQYLDIMLNNIDVITDIYNDDKNNHSSFIENRHDQSVCSLLSKYYNITNFNIYWIDVHHA